MKKEHRRLIRSWITSGRPGYFWTPQYFYKFGLSKETRRQLRMESENSNRAALSIEFKSAVCELERVTTFLYRSKRIKGVGGGPSTHIETIVNALLAQLSAIVIETEHLPKANAKDLLLEYAKELNVEHQLSRFLDDEFYSDISQLRIQRSLMHSDMHYKNAIMDSQGTLKIIDWEFSSMGSIWFDLWELLRSAAVASEKYNYAEASFVGVYDKVSALASAQGVDMVRLDRFGGAMKLARLLSVRRKSNNPIREEDRRLLACVMGEQSYILRPRN